MPDNERAEQEHLIRLIAAKAAVVAITDGPDGIRDLADTLAAWAEKRLVMHDDLARTSATEQAHAAEIAGEGEYPEGSDA